jgi:GNAT superfamily N-acetyltransferase
MPMPPIEIRSATSEDAATLFALIKALAEYENLEHMVTGSVEELRMHLFGVGENPPQEFRPFAEAIIAEVEGQTAGFALFCHNYSTFLTKPGIYLEDIFVLPRYRRLKIATTLFKYLAQLAIARNCGRLEWAVLDWNEQAIAFYEKMGATILPEWQICRVTGDALPHMANLATPSLWSN